MTKRLFLLLSVLAFALTSCSKDDEVLAFGGSVEALSTELADTVKKSEDKKAGLDAALKILDEKGAAVKATYAELQNVRGFQVKEETMVKMTESITKSTTDVMQIKIDLIAATMKDKDLSAKVDKLVDGYTALFN